jgi:outer membrane murein-binding lipoprotein Lpp
MGVFGPSRKDRELSALVDAKLADQRAAAKAAKEDNARADRLTRAHNAPSVWVNPEWRPRR